MVSLFVLSTSFIGATLLHLGRKVYLSHSQNKNALALTQRPPSQLIEHGQEKQKVSHYIKASTLGLGLVFLSDFIYAPLLIPAVTLILYSTAPILRSAYQGLRDGRIKASLVNLVFVMGMLLTRHYLISLFFQLIYFMAKKLLLETEDQLRKQLVTAFKEKPYSVWLVKNEVEIELPFAQLSVGDVIAVHSGEIVPIDGCIVQSNSEPLELFLLSENASLIQKEVGDRITTGTLVISGNLLIKVERIH